jgi:hypothetical protein
MLLAFWLSSDFVLFPLLNQIADLSLIEFMSSSELQSISKDKSKRQPQ